MIQQNKTAAMGPPFSLFMGRSLLDFALQNPLFAEVSFIGPAAFLDLFEIIFPVVIRGSAVFHILYHIVPEEKEVIGQRDNSGDFIRQGLKQYGKPDKRQV
jgi:hypothetical protein